MWRPLDLSASSTSLQQSSYTSSMDIQGSQGRRSRSCWPSFGCRAGPDQCRGHHARMWLPGCWFSGPALGISGPLPDTVSSRKWGCFFLCSDMRAGWLWHLHLLQSRPQPRTRHITDMGKDLHTFVHHSPLESLCPSHTRDSNSKC